MEEEFKSACERLDTKKIKNLLDHKQIPTKEHLEIIFKNMRTCYNEEVEDIIKLFIACGFVLDYDDITKLTEHHVCINELYTHDIHFDNKFFELYSKLIYCNYHDSGVNDYIPRQNYELKYLQFICCGIKDISYIKKIIKFYNVRPDITCLRNLCFHKSNYKLIKLFVEKYKLNIDKICLSNLVNGVSNKFKNTCLHYVVENLN
jgi:hypothetical protein